MAYDHSRKFHKFIFSFFLQNVFYSQIYIISPNIVVDTNELVSESNISQKSNFVNLLFEFLYWS